MHSDETLTLSERVYCRIVFTADSLLSGKCNKKAITILCELIRRPSYSELRYIKLYFFSRRKFTDSLQSNINKYCIIKSIMIIDGEVNIEECNHQDFVMGETPLMVKWRVITDSSTQWPETYYLYITDRRICFLA